MNHPGVFMQTIAQGFAVARGVNSPAVKMLADLYHEQIQAGNLIPTLETCWSEIGYIQFGDNPGRNEPGTGEINYRQHRQMAATQSLRRRDRHGARQFDRRAAPARTG